MESLKPEIIFSLLGFPVTNTVIATLITDLLIVVAVIALNRFMSLRPGRFQNIVEMVIESFYGLAEQVAGARTEVIFPWFISFFLFIVISNLVALVPGFNTITVAGQEGHATLFRAATSDLNVTLALAIVSVGCTHIMSLRYIGLKNYLLKFFSINPIFLFVGLLELVSEATKLLSLSFRLFGNIFAGEALLGTMSSLFSPLLAPLPFLALELLVAVIQALVFAMLTMVFMSVMSTAEHH